jgi:hypothetical protein
MIRARLSNGSFVLGIDANNLRELKAGHPIVVDLTDNGGMDIIMIVYGETLTDIMEELQEASGAPLPPAQPMPVKGTPS